MIVSQMPRPAVKEFACGSRFSLRQVMANRSELNQSFQVVPVQVEVRFPRALPVFVRVPVMAFVVTDSACAYVIPPRWCVGKRAGFHDAVPDRCV